MSTDNFSRRHIGPSASDTQEMLRAVGVSSIDELIGQVIPAGIRLKKPLNLPAGLSEYDYLRALESTAAKNKVFRSCIGLGYYGTIVPPVIQRNILENPGWYTAYTPYQAEIAQGRLEALLNFQTTVADLTGLPVAGASLLDEPTAAAEAMSLCRRSSKSTSQRFYIDSGVLPQTIAVVRTRAKAVGVSQRWPGCRLTPPSSSRAR